MTTVLSRIFQVIEPQFCFTQVFQVKVLQLLRCSGQPHDVAFYSDHVCGPWLPDVSRQSHLQKLFSNRGKIPDYQQLLEVQLEVILAIRLGMLIFTEWR
jgi:hypothetical protein